jgi:hypothetical protein
MPALANPRYERFAQELFKAVAKGGNHMAAYMAAGYCASGNKKAAKVGACRLLKTSAEIYRRVQELQAQVARRKRITVESVVAELEDARLMAEEERQAAAMTAASMGKAKISGLLVDKVEQGKAGDFANKSSDEIAEAVLLEINPNLSTASEEQKARVLEEMTRHHMAIEAIARGEDPTGERPQRRLRFKDLPKTPQGTDSNGHQAPFSQ